MFFFNKQPDDLLKEDHIVVEMENDDDPTTTEFENLLLEYFEDFEKKNKNTFFKMKVTI